MLEDIKIMLGERAANYTDELINLTIKQATAEVETYCNRTIDVELSLIVEKIVIIKLNRLNTEGVASQSYSGVSESYTNGYPADIQAVLNRKRKLKVI
jgi:hypothetical protein